MNLKKHLNMYAFLFALFLIGKAFGAMCVYQEMPPLPENAKFLADTDPGNDPDDNLSFLYTFYRLKTESCCANREFVGITTSLFRPDEKARIVGCISQRMGFNIPIHSGFGFYENRPVSYLSQYPCFKHLRLSRQDSSQLMEFTDVYPGFPATKFGIPGKTNAISLGQGHAFRKYLPEFNTIEISENTAVEHIIAMAQKYGSSLVLISQAPHTNLACAFVLAPEFMNKINRIVVMGGAFNERMGYNTSVDLWASQILFEFNKTVPVYILTSQFCSSYKLASEEKPRPFAIPNEILKCWFALATENKIGTLGKALCEDLEFYWKNKSTACTPQGLADVLTHYVAFNPQGVLVRPVKITFHSENFYDAEGLLKPICMFDNNIQVMETKYDCLGSNIFEVVGFENMQKDQGLIKEQILHHLITTIETALTCN